MSGHMGAFAISVKLQKVICLLSHGKVFESGEELLRELTGV